MKAKNLRPKCKFCNMNPDQPMIGVASFDDPHPSPADKHLYAYNLFQCQYCGAICKQDVWHNAGETWISVEGRIESMIKP
jgi:hypothetical protein